MIGRNRGDRRPSDTPTVPPEPSGALVGDGSGVTASGDAQAGSQNGAKAARRRARAKRRTATGRRLFARFDRELGCRPVAGADEAGRGSLAGPLVAAAVLFDLERLTLSDRRALSKLNDSKQHTAEGVARSYIRS